MSVVEFLSSKDGAPSSSFSLLRVEAHRVYPINVRIAECEGSSIGQLQYATFFFHVTIVETTLKSNRQI